MIQLQTTKHTPNILQNASKTDQRTVRRLIVLVPVSNTDLTGIAHRVWQVANVSRSHVQFLGLCENTIHEPELRRKLATLTAMVNNGNVSAEFGILHTKDWLELLSAYLTEGDMVACWQEQGAKLLRAKPEIPIYLLADTNAPKTPSTNWKAAVAAWIGSFAIIAAFFFLQVQINHLPETWSTTLQVISVIGEMAALLFWNQLSG